VEGVTLTTEDPRLINLGVFPLGSIPETIEYQFLDGDGAVVDLASGVWTAEVTGEQLEVTSQPIGLYGGTAAVDDVTATVSYAWDPDDFTIVGRFRLVIWTGNGTNRLGTPVYEYRVIDAPGDAPTV